jgi:thiol-disulfide isomerase/thioredoxin
VSRNNVVNINYYKNKENKKMIIIIALVSAALAILFWNFLFDNSSYLKAEVKESDNITYDVNLSKEISTPEAMGKIEESELSDRPILIYLYTSWCGVCKKQLPIMNEIARKFQNTDLEVLFITIDRDITKEIVIDDLKTLDKVYFKPRFLDNRSGFVDLLKEKSINFKNRIPFAALIDRDGKVVIQFSGYRSFKFINKKVMKSLYEGGEDSVI